jgi:hypothetical protein
MGFEVSTAGAGHELDLGDAPRDQVLLDRLADEHADIDPFGLQAARAGREQDLELNRRMQLQEPRQVREDSPLRQPRVQCNAQAPAGGAARTARFPFRRFEL